MSANVLITGVNHALCTDVFMPSTADPATIIVDCEGVEAMPREVTVRIIVNGQTFAWEDCKLSLAPRWMGTYVRFTLVDSRWRLATVRMRRNFNFYGLGGIVENERTVEELWQDITDESGIEFVPNNLDAIKPPAMWQGRTALECANELLKITACRIVYEPIEKRYYVSQAGTGDYPDRSLRFRRPAPTKKPIQVKVKTSPILYESALNVAARVPSTAGIPISLAAAGLTPIDFYSGFDSQGVTRRASLRNAAFRWWELISGTHPRGLNPEDISMQPFRSIQHLQPEIIGQVMTYLPSAVQEKTEEGIALSPVRIIPGDNMAYADKPAIVVNGSGVIETTAKLVTCYYAFENGIADTEEVTEAVGGTEPEEVVLCDWLLPVDSNRDDAPAASTLWEDEAELIAAAHATKWKGVAEHATIPGMVPTLGSGQIGAVRYRASLHPRRRFESEFAFNFVPSAKL
jgi:hypothetical protein